MAPLKQMPDGKSLNEATKLLVDAYEERMKSAA